MIAGDGRVKFNLNKYFPPASEVNRDAANLI